MLSRRFRRASSLASRVVVGAAEVLRALFEQWINLSGIPDALHNMEASDHCPPPSSRCLQEDVIQITWSQFEARFSLGNYKISSPSLPWNSRAHVLNIHYLFLQAEFVIYSLFIPVHSVYRSRKGPFFFACFFIGNYEFSFPSFP